MKLNFRLLLVAILAVQTFYAQQVQSFLTKIERNAKTGETIEDFFDPTLAPFYHGVASGDPLEDAVIIWTRVTTNRSSVDVNWKVATDSRMQNIVKQGQLQTNQSKDYTVKVDVTGLNDFTTYYYQFEALGNTSIIGRTKTAPAANVEADNLRFAVVSCSNYQNGFFNAYNQIANRNDLDAVIHLGDYIYEYETGEYGDNSGGRIHLPNNETVTLDDYRVRHSYYKLDPMLRNVHQQHPFIHIWDDHEFANDANKFGAQNHQPDTEGDWETRKNNAFKAYFEWMPLRANSREEYRLYRTISYGKLMDLIMLDTRIEGRDTQVTSSKNIISKAAKNDQFRAFAKQVIAQKDLTKEEDLKEVLTAVLPMVLNVADEESVQKSAANELTPSEFEKVVNDFAALVMNKGITKNANDTTALENLLKKGNKFDNERLAKNDKATYNSILGSEQYAWLTNELQSSTAKWRIIGNQVMMMPWRGVPTNDAWDGYAEERTQLLNFVNSNDIENIVVLTGDIHSTFAGEVRLNGNCKMCEFVTPSVTSSNLDALGGLASGLSEFYVRLLNNQFRDVDLDNHGYFVLDVKPNRVQADWFDTNILDRPVVGETRSRSWFVNANDCRVRRANTAAVAIRNAQSTLIKDGNTKATILDDFTIMGIYPIPMENEGNIHYIVNKPSDIKISIFDLNGALIETVQNDRAVEKGIYNLSFQADALEKGTYIVVLESNHTKASRKLIIK